MKRILLCLTLISTQFSWGQSDPHFSMWQASTSLLNPAATAAMNEDFSFFANTRMQWLSAVPTAFVTNAFCGEAKLGKENMASGWFGAGLHFYNDESGTTNMSTISAHVPISYVMEVNDQSTFSIGFRPGFINRALVGSFQTWDNQWNGIAFDQTVITGEDAPNKFTSFDLGTGIFYQTTTRNDHRFNIGISANHVNRPNVAYGPIFEEMNRQYLAHAGATFVLPKYRFRLSPQITTFTQGPLRYIMLGNSFDFVLREGSRRTAFLQDKTLAFGLYYRTGDAVIGSIILTLENFKVGISMDTPLSTSRAATGVFGAGELFLKYAFTKGDKRRLIR